VNLLVVVAPIFAIDSLLLKAKQKPTLLTVLLCCISALSLIFSISMVFLMDSQNTYLLIPFVICFALVAGIEISRNLKDDTQATYPKCSAAIRIIFGGGIGVGFFCGILSTFYLHYWNFSIALIPIRTISVTIFPLVVASIMASVLILINHFRKKKFNAQLFLAITLVASMSGSFVAHSLRSPLKQYVVAKNNWDSETQNVELKYAQLNTALQFVEVNSSSIDVIASNSTTDQGLIAAVTGVRNFATSYLPNFWGGVSDRYIHQSKFGRDGSFAEYNSLRQGCVTWFYLDKTEPGVYPRIWQPFAEIQYEDEFGAVLRMSDLVKLPSNC
jgi:hypothetical protein